MTPFLEINLKYIRRIHANHYRHVLLSSDQYLSTGGYMPQVFCFSIIVIQYLGKLLTSTRSGH